MRSLSESLIFFRLLNGVSLDNLVENKPASLRILDRVNLQEYYDNVLRIGTKPGTCIIM